MSKSSQETKQPEPRHLLIWRRASHQLPDFTQPAVPCGSVKGYLRITPQTRKSKNNKNAKLMLSC
jgi:hypothetical protein